MYVLVEEVAEHPLYWLGYFKDGKPALGHDFNSAAMFAKEEAAKKALGHIEHDTLHIEEHGW